MEKFKRKQARRSGKSGKAIKKAGRIISGKITKSSDHESGDGYVNSYMDRTGTDRRVYRQQTSQQNGRKRLMNIVLGGIGAVFGGELINKFGIAGAAWLNIWSVLVSVGGAALFLVVYNALARRALKTD